MIKTDFKTDFKSKHFCNTNTFTPLEQKDISFIGFKFYQKLFVVLISFSTILIYPESPKDLENICKKYNSGELCNIW